MIQLDRVSKSFGAVLAVRGVSLEIPKGQVVGLLGPNGAGKTTIVRMITGAIPPTSGSATVDGLDTVHDTLGVRQRLGYLPEAAPLYREMRVQDFLSYRASLYGVRGKDRRRAIDHAVARCQLQGVMRQRTGTLSKGFRQRVGIASVLLHDPKVLILDEPTSGLDPAQIAESRELVRDLSGERTTLIVSHILPEVERSCDRIILLARGTVRADGKPQDLVRALAGGPGGSTGGGAGRYVVECRGGGPQVMAVAQVFRAIPDTTATAEALGDGWARVDIACARPDVDHREAIARAAADAGLLVRELRPLARTLEDVYLRLIDEAQREPEATP